MTDTNAPPGRGTGLIDPDDLRGKVEDGEWVARQSSLGSMDICALRFYFDRQTPSGTYHTGSARAVGTAYHSGLECFYADHQATMTDRILSNDAAAAVHNAAAASYRNEVALGGDQFQLGTDTHEDNEGKISFMLSKYFDGAHYYHRNEWEVVGTEITFWDQLPDGQKVRGTIDLLVRNKITGRYRIEDHKTAGRAWQKGKEAPRKNVQAPFYFRYFIPAWWNLTFPDRPFKETYYSKWQWMYAVMTYAGRFERRDGTPSHLHRDLVAHKLHTAQQLITANVWWPNPTTPLCSSKFCDHWDRCPYGAAAC